MVKYLAVLLLFLGCAKEPTQIQSKKIVFKTKAFKFADSGFIENRYQKTYLQIYQVATPLLTIEIDKKYIYLNDKSFNKSNFNHLILSDFYEDTTLESILNGRDILNAKNKRFTQEGFEQIINDGEKFDIIYRVSPKKIYFKDRKSKILIKIEDTI